MANKYWQILHYYTNYKYSPDQQYGFIVSVKKLDGRGWRGRCNGWHDFWPSASLTTPVTSSPPDPRQLPAAPNPLHRLEASYHKVKSILLSPHYSTQAAVNLRITPTFFPARPSDEGCWDRGADTIKRILFSRLGWMMGASVSPVSSTVDMERYHQDRVCGPRQAIPTSGVISD